MSNNNAILFQGPVNLEVLLSRNFMGKQQYRSRFSLPVESYAYSTERKAVRAGQGRLLKQFLKNPVRTSPNRNREASRTLPKWIYQAIENYMVKHGHTHRGYTFELVGKGAPSITWRLKRLVSRRTMRYNPVKLLGAKGKGRQYDAAMTKLQEGKPLAFASEADKLIIDHWARRILFTLRATAFDSERNMEEWTRHHHGAEGFTPPIERQGARPILSDPAGEKRARLWFKSTGWYNLPYNLVARMDQEARNFAFSQPRGGRLLKAYVKRGPDNPVLNILNWPLEAADLYRRRCPPGAVVTEFTCYLRLEIYK